MCMWHVHVHVHVGTATPPYHATPPPHQARRVARRRVVVMDQGGGCELERLGFTVVKVGHLATCLEPFTTYYLH